MSRQQSELKIKTSGGGLFYIPSSQTLVGCWSSLISTLWQWMWHDHRVIERERAEWILMFVWELNIAQLREWGGAQCQNIEDPCWQNYPLYEIRCQASALITYPALGYLYFTNSTRPSVKCMAGSAWRQGCRPGQARPKPQSSMRMRWLNLFATEF